VARRIVRRVGLGLDEYTADAADEQRPAHEVVRHVEDVAREERSVDQNRGSVSAGRAVDASSLRRLGSARALKTGSSAGSMWCAVSPR
jgi:hypothetical protein